MLRRVWALWFGSHPDIDEVHSQTIDAHISTRSLIVGVRPAAALMYEGGTINKDHIIEKHGGNQMEPETIYNLPMIKNIAR